MLPKLKPTRVHMHACLKVCRIANGEHDNMTYVQMLLAVDLHLQKHVSWLSILQLVQFMQHSPLPLLVLPLVRLLPFLCLSFGLHCKGVSTGSMSSVIYINEGELQK
jgi:hypothetical protein